MSGVFGKNIKISVFGESHGTAVGVVIDGIKSGVKIDFDEIKRRMQKRAPGSKPATQRKEKDEVKILSGIYNGFTQGTPIAAVIGNTDINSGDYENLANIPRPSHADYGAYLKYGGFADMRGGGHFSGRLTAPLVFAGALAMQILKKEGVTISGRLLMAGGLYDKDIDYNENTALILDKKEFPVFDENAEQNIKTVIMKAKEENDSIGGIAEVFALGVKKGLGGALFDGIEGKISSALFAIPGVKGVEIGGGFSLASMKGSRANDAFYITDNGNIGFKTNNCGGILGGISTGEPIIARAAFKPTPSIAQEQSSVNLKSNMQAKITIEGRHDPCIALRGVYAVQSCLALTLLDLYMGA